MTNYMQETGTNRRQTPKKNTDKTKKLIFLVLSFSNFFFWKTPVKGRDATRAFIHNNPRYKGLIF